MINQFSNLSCYEEFEIQVALAGISKIDVLKRIGIKIDDYYFFVSNDGIFNWFDLEGNHIEDPGVLKTLICNYIPVTIIKCIIPDSVTKIDYGSFAHCISLKEITIPNSVTNIGDDAFCGCKSLKEITIPNSVTNIGFEAFFSCKSLTSIIIPNSVTNIGLRTFFGCKSLKEINISNGVTYIDIDAFFNCTSLTSITIPASVTYIGDYAFSNCNSLKAVIFKGKTLNELKHMDNYPWGIEDKSIIKCEL